MSPPVTIDDCRTMSRSICRYRLATPRGLKSGSAKRERSRCEKRLGELAQRKQPMSTGTQSQQLLSNEFIAKLEQLELVSRKIFVGRMKGERKSKRRGQSVEFMDHRNYAVGDDLRHIDWNVYGRLDKLFLKLFLEDEDLHFYTLVDTSLS